MQVESNQLVLKTDCDIFVDRQRIAARLLSCPELRRPRGDSDHHPAPLSGDRGVCTGPRPEKEKEKKKNKIKEINKSLSFFPSDISRELSTSSAKLSSASPCKTRKFCMNQQPLILLTNFYAIVASTSQLSQANHIST